MGTGTTIDSIYGVTGVDHTIEPGNFKTTVKLTPMNSYARYTSLVTNLENALVAINGQIESPSIPIPSPGRVVPPPAPRTGGRSPAGSTAEPTPEDRREAGESLEDMMARANAHPATPPDVLRRRHEERARLTRSIVDSNRRVRELEGLIRVTSTASNREGYRTELARVRREISNNEARINQIDSDNAREARDANF